MTFRFSHLRRHLPLVAQRVENPDIPADCGHPGDLDLYASVRIVEPLSIKEFLGPAGDLSRGIFALSPGEQSVRNLVERWSWTQPLEA